jgi:hypothetical protein
MIRLKTSVDIIIFDQISRPMSLFRITLIAIRIKECFKQIIIDTIDRRIKTSFVKSPSYLICPRRATASGIRYPEIMLAHTYSYKIVPQNPGLWHQSIIVFS